MFSFISYQNAPKRYFDFRLPMENIKDCYQKEGFSKHEPTSQSENKFATVDKSQYFQRIF